MKRDYSGFYKNLTSEKLLGIIENKMDYHADAIKAAQDELNTRNLNETEIQKFKKNLAEEILAKNNSEFRLLKEKATRQLTKVVRVADPQTPKSPELIMTIITLLLAMMYFYSIISSYDFFILMLQDIPDWDLSSFNWALPYIYLPFTVYFLLKQKKTGWSLLVGWLLYMIIGIINLYFIESSILSSNNLDSLITILYTPKGLIYYVILAGFFGGILYYLNTPPVRALYGITKTKARRAMIIAIVASITYLILLK